MADLAEDIRKRFAWRQVEVPKAWLPKEVGTELVGFYGGRTLRQSGRTDSSQYEVALIHVPNGGCVTVSGVKVMQLLDAANIEKGHPVRIIWQGTTETSKGYIMKLYNVLVADGDPVPVDALPTVQ